MSARRKNSSSNRRKTHTEKLHFLSQFKRISDPTNRRSVSRQYKELVRFAELHHKADRDTIAEAKKRGFFTTDKGLIVDGPRDGRRNPIPGAKMRIQKDATVVWSVKDRRDYIVGFTAKEKQLFAKDPETFVALKLRELKKKNPSLRKVPDSRLQTRLQWGAYQAQKDFSPQAFARLSTWQAFLAMHGVGRRKRKGDVDRLTGLHIVIHIPKAKKRARKGKKKK